MEFSTTSFITLPKSNNLLIVGKEYDEKIVNNSGYESAMCLFTNNCHPIKFICVVQ